MYGELEAPSTSGTREHSSRYHQTTTANGAIQSLVNSQPGRDATNKQSTDTSGKRGNRGEGPHKPAQVGAYGLPGTESWQRVWVRHGRKAMHRTEEAGNLAKALHPVAYFVAGKATLLYFG